MKKISKHKGNWFWIFLIIIAIVIVIILLSFLNSRSFQNVALIHIDGMILTKPFESFLPYSATYSDDIITFIEDSIKDPNIKAIIFEINSPGGTAVASSKIAEAIKKAKKEKLTIAVMQEQATSGAYWIASSCDYIIAHPLSITGSIGVLASYLEISGLLERFNVTYVNLTTAKHKDIMSPFRELTDDEREIIRHKLNIIHESFINEIAKNRNLDKEQVKELATGIFYLGSEAKELGLVDALGSKEDAIKYVEEKLNIKANIKEYKKPKSLFEKLFDVQSQANFWLGRGIGASLIDKNLLIDLNSIVPRT